MEEHYRRVPLWPRGYAPNRARRSEGVEILREESPARKATPTPTLFTSQANEAELRSYGEIQHCRATIYTPQTEEALRALVLDLAKPGRRITFRAGGCSLDGQSLNEDIVIFLDALDDIEVDDHPVRPTVKVGAGACWGDIVRSLEPRGLVPGVAVTASRATAGGTASVDGVSRFTSTLGKESTFIERFRLLTIDGEFHEVRRTATDPAERELYLAVIGGYGYLGVIVNLTYAVLRPKVEGDPRDRLRVRTRVRKSESVDTFADPGRGVSPELPEAPESRDPRAANPGHPAIAPKRAGACRTIARGFHARFEEMKADLSASLSEERTFPDNPRAFYGVVCPGVRPRGLAFESTYVRTQETKPMLQHIPTHPLRPLAEWVARWRYTSELFWWATYQMFEEGTDYVDDVFGYTFFMDGNVRTHGIERRLGLRTYTLQQTYVIPFRPDSLERFLERALAFFEVRKLLPLLFDVLYVPKDDVLLSASRGMDGFAVTIAFETQDDKELKTRENALRDLSRICLSEGGRVHLGKTVCVDQDVLAEMYAPVLGVLAELKKKLDPHGVLKNELLTRMFPDLAAQ